MFYSKFLRLFPLRLFSNSGTNQKAQPQLPVEIWQEIFYHACIVDLYQDSHDGFIPTRIRLALVSKHWNSIVLATPILWSQIVITSHTPSGTYLQRILHLSKSSVLEIYVNFSDLGRDQIPLLFSILRTQPSRLGTFILVELCYWQHAIESLQHLFPMNMHHSLDHLQIFYIGGDGYYARTPRPKVHMGRIISPNLTELALPVCYESILYTFCGIPDPALRKVDICVHEGWQTVQLVAKCPILERLTIRFLFDQVPPVPFDIYFPGTLTTLSLDIHGDDSSGIRILAKHLYFPGLRDLTFKFTSYGRPHSETSGAESLQELVLNKSPNILTLRLHFLYLDTAMLELFTYLKQLHALQLYTCRFQPDFLGIFCNVDDICPQLEEFTATCRYSNTFFQDIQSLLVERPQFAKFLTISSKLFTRDKERAILKTLQYQFPTIQVVS
ncbi:hypothetical protein Clacol_005317 [Clathrus columnatus]|uniref:F-box domain-containing protein n=1 Tax=Clathrus columnatus TaxID=1419009 RepID=A0AAV5A8Y5_9AGAM|nr:hypothetical protein Clacol_005317 [Clathrus columnatus]